MKEIIRSIFISLGADVCGIANIDRFKDAPEGFHPTDIHKDCRSVIVFGKALPKGVEKVNPRIIYGHYNTVGLSELDRIAYLAAREMERKLNTCVVPVPSDGPYEYWDAEKLEGRGLLSMRHAAVLAGIGTLGKNTMLMNSEYGNRLALGAVLTELDLPSDELAEELCIKSCRLCLDSCPAKALNGVTANQYLCRTHTYATNERGFSVVNCNRCRVVCPRAFGRE